MFSCTKIWLFTFPSDGKKLIIYNTLIELMVFADVLVNGRKISLLKLLYFRWNMWYLCRKQLIKFLIWYWHRKTIPVYIPIILVIYFTLNHSSFTKCDPVWNCLIFYSKNGRPYCLLWKIDIIYLLKPLTHVYQVFSDRKYSFTVQETSSNVVFRATTRLIKR